MKMLLTSGGIRNQSIHNALLDLLGKPISECTALYIPTALYGHSMIGPEMIFRALSGPDSMVALGWKSVGLLELTALPSLGQNRWMPWLEEADVLLVEGGDAMFLAHWMKESGLADILSTLNLVYVGLSAGSMVLAPRIGRQFVTWPEANANDEALGVVDFSIFPHLNYPGWESNTLAAARKWLDQIETPAYGIDDDTAIRVVDGEVTVVSEGEWHFFT